MLANPTVRHGTSMTLQSCPELRQGGRAFVFQHWPLSGLGLPQDREPNLGEDGSLGQREIPRRNPTRSHHQSGSTDSCLVPGEGIWAVLSGKYRRCVMHPYLTEKRTKWWQLIQGHYQRVFKRKLIFGFKTGTRYAFQQTLKSSI